MIIVPNIKLTQDGWIIREGINPEYSLAEILDFIAQNSDPLFVATFQSSKK